VSDLWPKALDAAADARELLRLGRATGANSRAYYAMFNAARALLVARAGIDVSQVKTHGGALKLFNAHIIDQGLIPPELGRALRDAFSLRTNADYSPELIDLDEAKRIVDLMDRLLQAASEHLNRDPAP
jgi:uncharacterized protein (UPF0332 family)